MCETHKGFSSKLNVVLLKDGNELTPLTAFVADRVDRIVEVPPLYFTRLLFAGINRFFETPFCKANLLGFINGRKCAGNSSTSTRVPLEVYINRHVVVTTTSERSTRVPLEECPILLSLVELDSDSLALLTVC